MKEAECDVIVDFAGFGQTTSDALESVRPKGTVVIVGMGKLESNINTYPTSKQSKFEFTPIFYN